MGHAQAFYEQIKQMQEAALDILAAQRQSTLRAIELQKRLHLCKCGHVEHFGQCPYCPCTEPVHIRKFTQNSNFS